jgi:hypothetical protein
VFLGSRLSLHIPVCWHRLDSRIGRLLAVNAVVFIFLPLLVVVCFCDREDLAELIFKSVNSLRGDQVAEACQFAVERDQRVIGCIVSGGCHFCPTSFVVVVFWL